MRKTTPSIALVSALGVMALVANAAGAIPGAKDQKSYTEHDYRRQLLEFNLRTTVEAYRQAGKHNAKWDAAATKFLEGVAHYISNAGAEFVYQMPDVPDLDTLEKLAREAMTAGCDDPLVLDMFCLVLNDEINTRLEPVTKRQELRRVIEKVPDQMFTSHYPVFRAANSARRWLRIISPSGADVRALIAKRQQSLYDADLASASLPDLPGIDRRIYLDVILDDFESWPPDRQKQFYEDLQKVGGDPWITSIIGGRYHTVAAWAARGGGFANTVTPEGWKVFEQELILGHDCLLEAYRLQPKFPEAASYLITIAMGGVTGRGESMRGWFDHAVEAQFDYRPAYSNYIYGIWPRWHGSYPEMFAFGVECVQTERSDTRVPLMYVKVLNDIKNDMNGSWQFWRQGAAMDWLSHALTLMGEQPRVASHREYYYSLLAGYAWQTGRYEVGKFAMDKINANFDAAGFDAAGVIPSRSMSGIYAFTGASGKTLLMAETDVADGNLGVGIEKYAAETAKLAPDSRETIWIKGRLAELKMQQQFDGGEWVNLIPSSDFDGWYNLRGEFSSDGKILSGQTQVRGAMLLCGTRFGTNWEIRANIEILPSPSGKPLPSANAGPVFGEMDLSHYHGVFAYGMIPPLKFKNVHVRIDGTENGDVQRSSPASPQTAIAVRCWEGQAEAFADGAALPLFGRKFALTAQPDARIGIGSSSKEAGHKFRITEFRIRKLTRPPGAQQGL